MIATATGVSRSTVLTPNTRGYSAPMLNHSSSCTRIGMDRNSHTYPRLTARSTGLAESRNTASRVPRAKPRTITTAVSHSVSHSPRRTESEVK